MNDKPHFRSGRSVRLLAALALAVAGLAVAAGCGGDDESAAETQAAAEATTGTTQSTTAETGQTNLVETADAAGEFTTLTSLLREAGLAETLAQGGPFTVFAPTDAAFAKVPKTTLDSLAANPEQLEAVLLYHVVEGEARAADVAGMSSAETLNGASVRLAADGGTVTVDDATVVQADVSASNGVIHAIDQVLIPA